GAAQPAVAQEGVDVVVAGDEPLAGRLEPLDRLVLPQRLVDRIGVGDERRLPGREPVSHTDTSSCFRNTDGASASEGPYQVRCRPETSALGMPGNASGPSSAVKA